MQVIQILTIFIFKWGDYDQLEFYWFRYDLQSTNTIYGYKQSPYKEIMAVDSIIMTCAYL